jgi:hypothetical protein
MKLFSSKSWTKAGKRLSTGIRVLVLWSVFRISLSCSTSNLRVKATKGWLYAFDMHSVSWYPDPGYTCKKSFPSPSISLSSLSIRFCSPKSLDKSCQTENGNFWNISPTAATTTSLRDREFTRSSFSSKSLNSSRRDRDRSSSQSPWSPLKPLSRNS